MARLIARAILFAAFFSTGSATASCGPSAEGYVPTAEVAARIAEAVLVPIYGDKVIASEKPFVVTLKDDMWVVTGKPLPKHTYGGVVEINISKRDGRIAYVCHGE